MMELWRHIYGPRSGVLALFSGKRTEPGSKRLEEPRAEYFEWPEEGERARARARQESAVGREVYHCGHLLTDRRRIKENAAPLIVLYVDGDGAEPGRDVPTPTAVVESSPGREQFYFRLTELVSPQIGERLNRRLALAMGADRSGWDLTQLLRVPGTRNHKYPAAPAVRLAELSDTLRHDPGKLDRMLPAERDDRPLEKTCRAYRSKDPAPAADLARLSPRMRDLIRYGNAGEYKSRSEADMAACLAMFGAGYTEAEVWAVMTDPANGISEKFLEKGRGGERYLALTIGKAVNRARREKPRFGISKARRVWRSSV